jgi:hypothetical protein
VYSQALYLFLIDSLQLNSPYAKEAHFGVVYFGFPQLPERGRDGYIGFEGSPGFQEVNM